jgi:adenylate kinase family enzyme
LGLNITILAMGNAGTLRRLAEASRIAVIGPCGAGKTTLANAIAARVGRPLVRLDELYWLPEWRRPPPQAWLETMRGATAEPYWVMDGNYQDTLPLRLARADLVVHLDLPTSVCLGRVLARDFRRWLGDRDDLPAQLRMSDRAGHHLTFWLHVARFRSRVRPQTLRLLWDWGGPVVVLSSVGEADDLLQALRP